jgi:hypothetical protein
MKTTETIRYARRCDVSGKGMNEGYCIEDGMMYIFSDLDMLNHITDETEYETLEEAYEDEYYYHTDWYETLEEEDEWYTKEGKLIEH